MSDVRAVPENERGRDRRLADHLEPPLSDGMLRREWARIEDRLDRGGRRSWRPIAAGAGGLGLAVAAVALLALDPFASPASLEPALVREGASVTAPADAPAPARVRLAEGTTIEVDRGGSLEVVRERGDQVRVSLGRGQARFSVAKKPGRTFTVAAGAVTVTVVGTRFSVQRRDDGSVDVRVAEGRVRVQGPAGDVRLLGADEALTVPPAVPTPPPSARATPPAVTAPDPPPDADDEGADPAPAPRADRRSRSGADELFATAGALRQDGDVRGAMARYEALVRRYPRDPRAALAAFEIGRLRMDRLGDPRGAARALGRALAADPPDSVREDAMARLVRAWAQGGAPDRCRRAKQAYLARYPDGVHAGAVRRATCGDGPGRSAR